MRTDDTPKPSGPRRAGRKVKPVPHTPAEFSPEEVARMSDIVDHAQRALNARKAEGWNQRRGRPSVPAIAHHGAVNSYADPYHPPVRRSLAAIERLLHTVERTTYQRMYTIYEDWVALTNILLDQLPAHMREAVEHGQISDWPLGTPPERIAAFERIKHRYGGKAGEAFTLFAQATGEFLEATNDTWFDWMGHLYMTLELGGRGVGDYYSPWPVAYMMAEMNDIPALLNARLTEALTHEDNALGAAVGMTALLFQPGPDGQQPVGGAAEIDDYFTRWLIPAAAPFFEPITVCDCACGSGVMLLAAASTVPLWARRYGFVQFYGQDIMHIAVEMTRAQTRAYGLNGFEAAMVASITDAGWDKFRARIAEVVAHQEAAATAEPLAAGPAPAPFAVIPRQVTGHIAHPTLMRKAADQVRPTLNLVHPSRGEAARLLASRKPAARPRQARL